VDGEADDADDEALDDVAAGGRHRRHARRRKTERDVAADRQPVALVQPAEMRHDRRQDDEHQLGRYRYLQPALEAHVHVLLHVSHARTHVCAVNLPDAVTLGGAHDGSAASSVFLWGHVICCSGRPSASLAHID